MQTSESSPVRDRRSTTEPPNHCPLTKFGGGSDVNKDLTFKAKDKDKDQDKD